MNLKVAQMKYYTEHVEVSVEYSMKLFLVWQR